MTAVSPGADGLIWLTRGKSWGFRFVLDGGLPDPLPEYERVFERVDQDESTACDRVAGAVALRFPETNLDSLSRLWTTESRLSGLLSQTGSTESGTRQSRPTRSLIYRFEAGTERSLK